MDNETKLYEVGYLLLPMLAEETLPVEIDALRATVEKHTGVIESAELPKSRQLAYTISKKIANKRTECSQAYFGVVLFRAPAEAAPAIKSDLDKNEHILRFMLIETVPYEAPVRRVPREEGVVPEDKPKDAPEEPKEKEVEKTKLSPEEMDKEVEELIAVTV